jgi:hypothetical protein
MTAVVLMSAVALCTGTLVFALTCFVTGPKSWPAFGLTSGTGFTITSTISSSPTTQVAAVLYPGANRYLWYTAHNPLTVPITVTSMKIATVTSQSPTGCPTSNLNYGQTTFSGTPTLVVPARVGTVDGTNSVPVPISLYDTNTNQDRCEGVTFNFVYAGTANYTDTTTTALTSWPNPSASGNLVTFTATVVPTVTPPGNPTGTVDFYQCATASCSSTTLLGSGSLHANGQAKYSTSSLAVGTDLIEAIYQGAPTDFSGSTSNTVSQVVIAPLATTTVLTSAPNPSVLGGTVVFTATVARSSGTGTPTGTVNFYKCASAANCSSPASLGSGTLHSGRATYSTSGLLVGSTYVEAVYEGVTGSFSASTSNIVTQVVTAPIATTTVLSSSPNPSGLGKPVTLTATVTKSSGSGNPTGTVSFYSGTPSGFHSPVGTATLNSGKATFTTSGLPAGTDSLYGLYSGDTNFSGSTSPVISELVVSLPSRCTGRYTNWFFGNPASPNITGTNGNDFIYAFGGNFRVNDFNGDDGCFYGGDGNNWLSDGNGNDVALAGDGNNVFTLGNGNDQITVGNGTNTIGAGNGADSVTLGNGSHNGVTLGYGNDTVTLGSGSYNGVALGSGTDVVTIQGGSYDQINGGAGNETIYLGAGTYNTYDGAAHHTNLCHLPAPPSSSHGTAAGYYHDTVTNCTVVTP